MHVAHQHVLQTTLQLKSVWKAKGSKKCSNIYMHAWAAAQAYSGSEEADLRPGHLTEGVKATPGAL
eukprot:1749289-Amphidinium_carterae.1